MRLISRFLLLRRNAVRCYVGLVPDPLFVRSGEMQPGLVIKSVFAFSTSDLIYSIEGFVIRGYHVVSIKCRGD